ncbi:7927_t:CDS:2, partial [Racocetra persica]
AWKKFGNDIINLTPKKQFLCIKIGIFLDIDFTRLYLKSEEDSDFIFKPIYYIAAKLENENLDRKFNVNVKSYDFASELLNINFKNTTIHQQILDANDISSFSKYMKQRIQRLERMLNNLDNNSTQNISISRFIKKEQDYIRQIENLEK